MRVIPGGGPGPKLTTITYNADRGDVVIQAQYGLSAVSSVIISAPGHEVQTYNFESYSDTVLGVFFEDGGKPIFDVKDGQQVGVQVIAKGGNPKGHFTYHKPSQPAA